MDFDRNILFVIPLAHDDLDYCYNNFDETKGIHGYKVVLKSIIYFQQKKISAVLRSKNMEIIICVIKRI